MLPCIRKNLLHPFSAPLSVPRWLNVRNLSLGRTHSGKKLKTFFCEAHQLLWPFSQSPRSGDVTSYQTTHISVFPSRGKAFQLFFIKLDEFSKILRTAFVPFPSFQKIYYNFLDKSATFSLDYRGMKKSEMTPLPFRESPKIHSNWWWLRSPSTPPGRNLEV